MKKIIIILLTLFLCISCKTVETVYVYPELPNYEISVPKSPTLMEIPEGSSMTEAFQIVAVNTSLLMGYSKELEVYNLGFLDFYKSIQNTYKNRR